MTTPEEALDRAREAVAERRAHGEDLDADAGFRVEPADNVDPAQLLEWAVIEPDPELIYSTRRLGAPITLAKRLLIRALRQYTVQLVDQQTRFNLQLASFAAELDRRVGRLETAAQRDRSAPADPGGREQADPGGSEPADPGESEPADPGGSEQVHPGRSKTPAPDRSASAPPP